PEPTRALGIISRELDQAEWSLHARDDNAVAGAVRWAQVGSPELPADGGRVERRQSRAASLLSAGVKGVVWRRRPGGDPRSPSRHGGYRRFISFAAFTAAPVTRFSEPCRDRWLPAHRSTGRCTRNPARRVKSEAGPVGSDDIARVCVCDPGVPEPWG